MTYTMIPQINTDFSTKAASQFSPRERKRHHTPDIAWWFELHLALSCFSEANGKKKMTMKEGINHSKRGDN